MQRLDEMEGPWTGETDRVATGFGNKDEEDFRAMVEELIGRRGMPARSLHRIIDEVESGYVSTGPEEGHGAKYDPSFPESKYPPMQEAYTRTKKRKK